MKAMMRKTSSLRIALQPITLRFITHPTSRALSSLCTLQQQQPPQSSYQYPSQRPSPSHTNFYKTHGRALFKSLTLAFLSYQFFYWTWLTFENEADKHAKNAEIKGLEGEVRLLESGRGSHSPTSTEKVDGRPG